MEYLFRAAARGSELTAEGRPIFTEQDQRERFLDLASGLESLTAVVAYADRAWRHELSIVRQHYGRAVFAATQKGLKLPESLPKPGPPPYIGPRPFKAADTWPDDLTQVLWLAAVRIQEIATLDLSGYESREAAIEAARSADQ